MSENTTNLNQEIAPELQIPTFMGKGNNKKGSRGAVNKEAAINLFRSKVEALGDPECELIDDLDLIVSIIQRYGLPDKVSLKCVLEYDSDTRKNNKRFVVQR